MTRSTPDTHDAPIAVVSAMHEELRALLPQLNDVRRKRYSKE